MRPHRKDVSSSPLSLVTRSLANSFVSSRETNGLQVFVVNEAELADKRTWMFL